MGQHLLLKIITSNLTVGTKQKVWWEQDMTLEVEGWLQMLSPMYDMDIYVATHFGDET